MIKPNIFQWIGSYFWPVTIKKATGELGHDLEIIVYHGKVMLDTNKVNYSFGQLHQVMDCVLKRLESKGYSFDKVLLLGYGGGSAAQIIHSDIQWDSQIVGVEADQVICNWAQEHFYSQGVKLLKEDAFDYVKRAIDNEWTYNVVVVDLFVDDTHPDWPSDFWANLKRILNSSGVAVINTMMEESSFRELGKHLEKEGFLTQPWNEIKENRVWVIKP